MPCRVNLNPKVLTNKFYPLSSSYRSFLGSAACYTLMEMFHVAKKPAVFYCEAVTNLLMSIHFSPFLP